MTGLSEKTSTTSVEPRRWGDLGVRALSALVMVAVAVVTAVLGGQLFALVWLAASLAVLWEWQTLVGGSALRLRVWTGGLALVLAAVLVRADYPLPALLPLVLAAVMFLYLAGEGSRVWASAGVLFAGILLLATLGLRFSSFDGARAIVWLFATVWSTDTFAYFGGRLIGGPKLAPRISPSKTWSGTLTGLAAGSAIGTLVAIRDLPGPSAVLPILLLTCAVSCASQAGDAFESAMKRRFRVKDSSRLIPGHGGVMDRVDGFIAAAALAFCVGMVRDPHSVASGLFHWT